MDITIKLRLYPNQAQKRQLFSNAGACRFIYNWALEIKEKTWKKYKKNINNRILSAQLTKLKQKRKYKWLLFSDSQALQQSLLNLDKAYKNFFRRVKNGVNSGFPKFKKFGQKESFRLTANMCYKENQIRLSSLGWFKCSGNNRDWLDEDTKIRNITVKLEGNGNWYAMVLIEKDTIIKNHKFSHKACGIDLGVINPVTIAFDNGKCEHHGSGLQERLNVLERRRKRHQKALARKKKGSKNRVKALARVKKDFYKESCVRKDWQEQASHEIASTCKIICLEDLQVARMTRSKVNGKKSSYKRKLNHNILQIGWSRLRTRIEQKAVKFGSTVVAINPSYTSQTCSSCGCISKDNRRSQSKFECIDCGFKFNADKNAAKVILALAA